MPNTLVHIGVQLGAGRLVAGRSWSAEWLLLTALGCVLPDVPWIAQRALRPVLLALGRFDDLGWPVFLEMRLWCVVQSSLLFTGLLAFALAQFTRRRVWAFAVLVLGSAVHLLLDALQIKWGNGVVLFAPWSWSALRADWLWPESTLTHFVTAFGVVASAWATFWVLRSEETVALRTSGPRWVLAGVAVAIYLVAPVALRQQVLEDDPHSLGTLALADPTGREVELHRAAWWRNVSSSGSEPVFFARALDERVIRLEGPIVADLAAADAGGGRASIRGVFTANAVLRVDAVHSHPPGVRAGLSVVGVVLLTSWCGLLVFRSVRRGPGSLGPP